MKSNQLKSLVKCLSLATIISSCMASNASATDQFLAAKNQFIVELTDRAKSNPQLLGVTGPTLSQMAQAMPASPVSVIELNEQGVISNVSDNPQKVLVSEDAPFCAKLIQNGLAKSCSPNFVVRSNVIPNDGNVSGQYWHQAIDSAAAWDVTTGNDSAVVAVLDTGVDFNHPDLVDNMWRNPGEVAGNNIDDDGNGVIDDVFGFNAENNGGNPLDDNNHGTHVAGIIGAKGNNGVGIAGVNWRTKIMALKFLRAEGYGFTSDAIKALDYMVMMKNRGINVRVVNNSWGGGGFSKTLEDAIKRVNNAGIIFTAAAGNSGSNNDILPQYPANYEVPNIVSVAASEEGNTLASFSCFGNDTVHISAPGSYIKSTVRNGGYQNMSGTSMATPFVTGALGLLLSHNSNLTVAQAIERLKTSGTFQVDQEGLSTTSRMLNVNNLVRNIPGTTPPVGEVCQYDMQNIAFNPPTGLEQNSTFMPTSGQVYLNNRALSLPFDFSFYGKIYKSVTVGVNGILHFENPDDAWTFRGGSFAPRYSIAPLYTYLFPFDPITAPEGVRTQVSAERVDIQWSFKHQWNMSAGLLKVTVSIFPNGTIDLFTSVPNDRLSKVLSYGAVTGIRGANLANSSTLTANNFPIVVRGNLGFRFSRPSSCNAVPADIATPTPTPTPYPTYIPNDPLPNPAPTVTPAPESVNVSKLQLAGPRNKAGIVKTRASFNLKIQSKGNGNLKLKVGLNGGTCGESVSLPITSASSKFKIAMPTLTSNFKRISVSAGKVITKASITGSRLIDPAQRTLKRGCKRVIAKFRQAVKEAK